MKKLFLIATVALLFAACNGAGSNSAATKDTANTSIGRDSSMSNNLPENGSQTRTDTMKTSGAKPDSTMRQ